MDGQHGCPTTPTERRVPGMSNSRSAAICPTHFSMDVHPSGPIPVAAQLSSIGRSTGVYNGRTTQPQSPQRYHRRQVLAQLCCTDKSQLVACMVTRSHVTAGSSQRAPMYAQLRSKSCRWESAVRCGAMASMSVAVSLLSTTIRRRPATQMTRGSHNHTHTRQQPHTATHRQTRGYMAWSVQNTVDRRRTSMITGQVQGTQVGGLLYGDSKLLATTLPSRV